MTRKDFQALAEMVKDADYLNDTQRYQLATQLAYFCKQQNPNFDKERFFAACGV